MTAKNKAKADRNPGEGRKTAAQRGPVAFRSHSIEQERIIRALGLWMFINGEADYKVCPRHVAHEGNIWLVRSAVEPGTGYAILT